MSITHGLRTIEPILQYSFIPSLAPKNPPKEIQAVSNGPRRIYVTWEVNIVLVQVSLVTLTVTLILNQIDVQSDRPNSFFPP